MPRGRRPSLRDRPSRGPDRSFTAQRVTSRLIRRRTIAEIDLRFPRAHVTLRLSRGRRSPDRGFTWAQPAGRDLAGGPWQAAGSGSRCCWRRRWLAWPRRCGPGPSTSKPTTGATPCTPTTSTSGTMPAQPRRLAASSSMRLFDATVTCSSVPALGPDPTSKVSLSLDISSEGIAFRGSARPASRHPPLPPALPDLSRPFSPCSFCSLRPSLHGLARFPFTPSLT